MASSSKKRRSSKGEDAGSIARKRALTEDVHIISDDDDGLASHERKRVHPPRTTQRSEPDTGTIDLDAVSDDEEVPVVCKRFAARRTTPRSIKDFFCVKSPPPADDYEGIGDEGVARKLFTKRTESKKRPIEEDDEDTSVPSTSPPRARNRRKRKKRTRKEELDDEVVDLDDDEYTAHTTRHSSRLQAPEPEDNVTIGIFDDVSADEEEPRKKRSRVQVKYQSRITPRQQRYKEDDFIVSDTEIVEEESESDEGDGGGNGDASGRVDDDARNVVDVDEEDDEDEDEEGLEPVNSVILDALEGKRPPFSNAMICGSCRNNGAEPLGTAAKGWRDGYVQPAGNFSAAVRRENYGLYRREPFCLQHANRGQNDHIEYLQAETEANRDFVDTSESEREDEEP